ncbi:MAG: TonB-dependent receptor domain-containing protein, partial [Gammaproteobacteria bacterium]
AVGRIYRDLGFEQRALVEGWKSVNTDPGDYSGHRLLADSYSSLRRHEIARVSELLQSQLLQPINLTPLQPQLAETNLRILEGTGPAEPAFNEFNPLFTRDRFTLQASGVVAGNDTYSDELTHSGLRGRFAYSLGQFHYETEGFRDNNDLEHDIYNAFAQVAVSPSTNLQIELRHQGTESGDLTENFDPNGFIPDLRTVIDAETARLGFHSRVDPQQDILASFVYRDLTTRILPGDTLVKTGAYSVEAQYQFRNQLLSLTVGAGHSDRDRTNVTSVLQFDPVTMQPTFDPVTGMLIFARANTDVDGQHTNVYGYTTIEPLQDVQWTFGVAYDRFDSKNPDLDRDRWSPKIGVIWQALPETTFRAAWFKTMKRAFVSNQTVEPTQVAGFNQFFDDDDGTETERYGVGIDQVLTPRLSTGLELSWRDISTGFTPVTGGVASEQRDEHLHRAYLYWTPTDAIALSAEYFLERFDRVLPPEVADNLTDPVRITTHRAPFAISYYHPDGLFARLVASYVNQDVEIDFDRAASSGLATTSINSDTGSSDFWVVDASIGYRLPRRWGIVSFGARNLFDNEFRYLETSTLDTTEPFTALFQPDQIVYTQFTLSF